MTTSADDFQLEELESPDVPTSLTSRAKRGSRKVEHLETLSDPTPAEDVVVSRHTTLIAALEAPLDRTHVKQRDGYGYDKKTGKRQVLDYLEWHTVVRQLNHFFGYGIWGTEVSNLTDLGADPATGVPYAVRATVKLTVEFPAPEGEHYGDTTVFENVGVGVTKRRAIYENDRKVGEEPPTWDAYEMAVKTAVHDALKRCAVNLGEQFGLSLYDKDADDTAPAGETEGSTTHEARRTTTYTASSSSSDSAECESCGRAIIGYTSNAGKTYTTQDLVNISKKSTGGHVFCYRCRQDYQSNRDR